MKITVLGTGMVGRVMAAKLISLGHQVEMATRNIEHTLGSEQKNGMTKQTFGEWHKANSTVSLVTFNEAGKNSDVLFNCTSGMASLQVFALVGKDNLRGKVILDLANPLDFSNGMPPSLNPVNTDSLGEQLQRTYPDSFIVKTLNTMNMNVMVNPGLLTGEHHVFVSGNDESAKQKVKLLLAEFGWKPNQILDLGDITTARGTEMLLPIWLRLWGTLGTATFNFHIQQS
ncbi:NADP oxidoreductase [bacterium]|nr:MAG: NADP oxidoreductase [bacterium]